MGECNEEAHCWVNSPAGCFPNSDSWPLMGTYSIPRSSRWSSSEEADAQAGYHGKENAPGGESLDDKVLRFIHPIREPFTPSAFIEKAASFLKSIGVVHVVSVEIDGTPAYTLQGDNPDSIAQFEERSISFLQTQTSPVKFIELRVLGKSNDFFMDMSITYRPVHSAHEPGLSFAVEAKPAALDLQEGETMAEHELRLEKLALNSAEVEKLQEETQKKASSLTDDLSHHISEAFPGTKFNLSERDETRLALGLGG